jgi:SAM-dependent methyltransferase
MKHEEHYDKNYWEWQSISGKAAGVLEKFKFEKYIDDDHTVLDFGCGGGYILSNLECSKKIGIEVNPHAREQAKKNGIEVYSSFDDLQNQNIDVIISNHALEHVLEPIKIIQKFYENLKSGGYVVCVVPFEQSHEDCFLFDKNDINQHLFNWTPRTLGNLFQAGGFKIIEATTVSHQFTPNFINSYENPSYHFECVQYAKKMNNLQTKIVAYKEK